MGEKLSGALARFSSVKALVLGDLMLDKYTSGEIQRISPEAPVNILNVVKKSSRPGGAGNVVLNLLALNARVTVLGRLGFDKEGAELTLKLKQKGADTGFLIRQRKYPTITKNRLIASSQQLIRIDSEKILPLPAYLERKVVSRLKMLIPHMQVVAVSDYQKGFLTKVILQKTIELCRFYKVPVIVDPKGSDFAKYQQATILKPNQKEAYIAAKKPLSAPLEEIAKQIMKEAKVEKLLITRSEHGMALFDKKLKRKDFPVRVKEVNDVTGAGDTALSTLAAALASGFKIEEAITLANIAAGIAIEHLGCRAVALSELSERLLELDVKSKVFNQNHLYALKQVLKNKKYTLLGVESKKGMSNELFRSLHKLSAKDAKLIVYLKDEKPSMEFVEFLSAIPLVDFIITHKKSLQELKKKIKPFKLMEI